MKIQELLKVFGPWVKIHLYGSSDRFGIYGVHLASDWKCSLYRNIDWHDWRTLEVEDIQVLNKNEVEVHIDLYESGTEERLADDKFKTDPDIPEIVPSDEDLYLGRFEPDPVMAFHPLIGEKK